MRGLLLTGLMGIVACAIGCSSARIEERQALVRQYPQADVFVREQVLDGTIPLKVAERELRASEEANLERERRLTERESYIAGNPQLDRQRVEAIRAGRLLPGMTTEEVRLSWGEPQRRMTKEGDGGITETWVYADRTFLSFRNGELTSWDRASGF